MEDRTIHQKISDAKLFISKVEVTKAGHNTYSNYDYFTPEQVSKIVSDACRASNLITYFSMEKNELGYFGKLEIVDLDSGLSKVLIYHTEKPKLTASNSTQEIGGMITYTQRYAEMTAFGLVDNQLDLDTVQPSATSKNPTVTPKKVTIKKITGKKMTKKQFLFADKQIKNGMSKTERGQLITWLSKFVENQYKLDIEKALKNVK